MTNTIRIFTSTAAAAALLVLSACGTQPSQPVYQGGATQGSYPANTSSNTSVARYGVVQSINMVQQESSSGIGAGAIVGAVVGGVLGSQVGGGSGRTAATVIGAAGGAYAGNEIQKSNQPAPTAQGVQLNVRLFEGDFVTVTQASAVDIRVGDRVVVQNGVARRY